MARPRPLGAPRRQNQAASLGTGLAQTKLTAGTNEKLDEANALTKENMDNNSEMNANVRNADLGEKFGAEIGSMVAKGSTLDQAKNEASMENVMNQLGGKDSGLYQSFAKNMSENMGKNSGNTFDQNASKAMADTLNSSFGNKTSDVYNTLTGNGKNSQVASGLIDSYSKVSNRLQSSGMNENQVKEKIGGMNKNITSDFNSGKLNIENMENINKHFDELK